MLWDPQSPIGSPAQPTAPGTLGSMSFLGGPCHGGPFASTFVKWDDVAQFSGLLEDEPR